MARAKKKTTAKSKTTKSTVKSKTSRSAKSKRSIKSVKATQSFSLKDRITNQKLYDQLKLSESYISLILGAIVVVGVSAIFFVFIRESRRAPAPTTEVINNAAISPVLSQTPVQTYVMQENESLWDVAVREYGDGFRYVDIVEANPEVITNPDYVPPGTKIVLPPRD